MSQGTACKCPRSGLVVDVRRANYSAFSGYHRTPSKYSAVRCTACGSCWRTDAKYVSELPDAPEVEAAAEETTRQQEPRRFLSQPYDPICIVTKEPHQPRENDPARCRSCGLFIQEEYIPEADERPISAGMRLGPPLDFDTAGNIIEVDEGDRL